MLYYNKDLFDKAGVEYPSADMTWDEYEALAKKILNQDEVEILVSLKEGCGTATCWGCDLTYDYVRINGDYRS